ncbi:carbohydrate kinase family protein [Paenibacillus radicis (ex Gao et al. 2016)]|uniref:Sugar kinase n=1 Tax=Paenibacillus radicis (ex Gao et al. 2016) TaxID=1737354 RepID=A0A917GYG9_9BACL|nr:carbohydrate kinase family protein [Paenibacillus radicis (ex Gao et al. 2016)]GGG61254.1 sugar kinase [Paenibacillus radicis (ex Gao et al. 2016)]
MDNGAAPYPIIVGGHICLDIIPAIPGGPFSMAPGKLLNIGQASLSTGGAVANTGLALQRLGLPVKLMGKVGDDFFGQAILSIIGDRQQELTEGMIVAAGEASSYSIVINPPQVDRMFLHCTGANDTFKAEDVTDESLEEAGLFHFGYPPLMRHMYENGGAELAELMRRAKAAGVTTSMDMAKPDTDAPSGQVDWREILARTLPDVDLFLPSVEEILFMLRRDVYDGMIASVGSDQLLSHIDAAMLEALSSELLDMGAAIVALKLGEYGLYVRTTASEERMARLGRYQPRQVACWLNRELYVPCFRVEVAGTTGAGDCTIAGFLAGFVQGLSPEDTVIGAVATGACNVEQPDATSGIPAWRDVQSRLQAGWAAYPPRADFSHFHVSSQGNAVIYDGSAVADFK